MLGAWRRAANPTRAGSHAPLCIVVMLCVHALTNQNQKADWCIILAHCETGECTHNHRTCDYHPATGNTRERASSLPTNVR
jgi:hypothetical protein